MGAPSADLERGGGGIKGELTSVGSDASSGGSQSLGDSPADGSAGQETRASGDLSSADGSASSASTAASPPCMPVSSASHELRPSPSQGELNKSGQFVLGGLHGYTAPFLSRVVELPDDPGRSYELDEASERHLLFNAPSGLELTESMLGGFGDEVRSAAGSSGGASSHDRTSTGSAVTYVQYATEGEEERELKERQCCGRPVRVRFRVLVQAIFVGFLVVTAVVLLAPLMTAYSHTIDEVADTCKNAAVQGLGAFVNVTKGLELSVQMLSSLSSTSVLRQLLFSVPHTVNALWNSQWYSAGMLPPGTSSAAMGTYAADAPASPDKLNLTLWGRSAGSVMINIGKLGTQSTIFKMGYTTANQTINVAFGRVLPSAAEVSSELDGFASPGLAPSVGQYNVSAGTAALFFFRDQRVASAVSYPIDLASWKPVPALGTTVNEPWVNYELLIAPLTRQREWANTTTDKNQLVGLWSHVFKSVGPSTVFPGPGSPSKGDYEAYFCYSFSWPWARCADGREHYDCLSGAFSGFFSSNSFSLYTNSVLMISMNAFRPLQSWRSLGLVYVALDDNGFPMYIANETAAARSALVPNVTAFAQIVNSSAIFHIASSAPVRKTRAPALPCLRPRTNPLYAPTRPLPHFPLMKCVTDKRGRAFRRGGRRAECRAAVRRFQLAGAVNPDERR